MKTIVAGSRYITDPAFVIDAVDKSDFEITEVVSGGQRGVDKLGEDYAEAAGLPLKVFEADWNKYGDSAGPIRNGQMAEYADAAIIVWDGKSRGSKDMMLKAYKNGLKVYVYNIGEPNI